MRSIRLIPRLDVKGSNLIKGIHLEGLRKIGNPNEYARMYYAQGADEIIYMDIVASLYGRNNLLDIVKETVKDVFVPITVGGGIRSTEDVRQILLAGADKVAINTAAIQNPKLITEIANQFGSQCIVLSVEAKRTSGNSWEAYTDNGREKTGRDVLQWVKEATDLGVGEIFVTSVDQEGTRKGYDWDLMKSVSKLVTIPVIASGGLGSKEDLVRVVQECEVDAVAVASLLHYKELTVGDLRDAAVAADIRVRPYA